LVKNPEKIGNHINKLIANQEAIQKTELANNLFTKYIKSESSEDALPLLAYLYGTDIEILAAFLKSKKDDNFDNYMKLSNFDKDLNNKKLFKKIVTKIE